MVSSSRASSSRKTKSSKLTGKALSRHATQQQLNTDDNAGTKKILRDKVL